MASLLAPVGLSGEANSLLSGLLTVDSVLFDFEVGCDDGEAYRGHKQEDLKGRLHFRKGDSKTHTVCHLDLPRVLWK